MKSDVFVVVGCRSEPKCAQAVDMLSAGSGSNVAGYPLDVNDTKSVKRFIEQVAKRHGVPGILVNNAGVSPEASDAKVTDEGVMALQTLTKLRRLDVENTLATQRAIELLREKLPRLIDGERTLR